MEEKKTVVKSTTPEGYIKLNVFIRPEYVKRMNDLAKRNGMKKYFVLDNFLAIYWSRFEKSMDDNLEKALENMKKEMGRK